MAETKLVEVERRDAVAVLTLSNPARRNALSEAMRIQLLEALRALNAEEGCRAIVLTGAGGHFCAGGDITEMEPRPLAVSRTRMLVGTELARTMVTGAKPIVAAVEGAVAGAGVSLAAACDFVLAAESARFTCAFIKVGLLPDIGGLYAIPRRVGLAKARELFGLGASLDAAEALRIGLANRLAGPDLLAEAVELAQAYAALPPLTSAILKAVMARGVDTLDQALASELDHQPMLRMTDDHREAVAAFLEKRPARFSGR